MQLDFTGKRALVTGSTKGIGLATARALADAGAEVIVTGRSADEVRARADEIGGQGYAADLGTAKGCDSLISDAGRVDILVNNAGIFQPVDFFETEDAIWDDHWRINVMSAMRLTRALAPGMVARKWGRIVMLGSESAFNIPTEMIHYGISKTADVALARGVAKRLAGTGVTVNSVLPGPTLSDGVKALIAEQIEESGETMEDAAARFAQQERPTTIIQRTATVEEVANMIVYVCSEQASATTGASLRVDGGIIDTI